MNTTRTRPVLTSSFVVTSLAGIAFLLAYWLTTDVTTAWVRAGVFVASMAIIHVVGYQLYCTQDPDRATRVSLPTRMALLRPHLPRIACTQLPCLLVSALLLDGGYGFRLCLIAGLAHWTAIAFVLSGDRVELRKMELFVLRFGFFPSVLFGALVGWTLWS